MKLIDLTSWCYNHDLMTDAVYIEEDRQRGSDEISEHGASIMIVLSAFAVWFLVAAVLWPV